MPQLRLVPRDDSAIQGPLQDFLLAKSASLRSGDFLFEPKDSCKAYIESRGGRVAENVSKRVKYLVVGSAGSAEWKHGSYGTKIARALHYTAEGTGILLVRKELCFPGSR
jgi:NAD-dependent DNA ligase